MIHVVGRKFFSPSPWETLKLTVQRSCLVLPFIALSQIKFLYFSLKLCVSFFRSGLIPILIPWRILFCSLFLSYHSEPLQFIKSYHFLICRSPSLYVLHVFRKGRIFCFAWSWVQVAVLGKLGGDSISLRSVLLLLTHPQRWEFAQRDVEQRGILEKQRRWSSSLVNPIKKLSLHKFA